MAEPQRIIEAPTPVEEAARRAADECDRAVRAGTPLFLVVLYQYEADKLAYLSALARAMRARGVRFQTLDPRHRAEHGTGRLYDAVAAAGARTVSVVPDLPRTEDRRRLASPCLEYLNLHRDRIAREKLRLVLLLHTSDAEQLITEAGDLWDFRHRTEWLERSVSVRGVELWRELGRQSAELPLPAADRDAIVSHVASVRALIDATDDPKDRAALLLDLSQWLERRHAASLAAEVAAEGLALSPEEAKALRGQLQVALGFALYRLGNLPGALNHFELGLEILRELGERRGEALILHSISRVYRDWGRWEEALRVLEESLAISHEVGDRTGQASTLINISQIYQDWGRSEEALRILEESLAISRKARDRRNEAVTLNNIASIHQTTGRLKEALRALEESLATSREVGDRRSQAATLNNISQIYQDRGQADEALRVLEESLAIDREVGDRTGEAVALNNISQIYHAWGRSEEALTLLEESLAIHREVGNRVGEAVTSWNLARLLAESGDIERAVELIRRTVEIHEQTGHPDLEKDRKALRWLEERLASEDVQRGPAVPIPAT